MANSKQVSFECLQNVVLVTHERTPVGKEFHARGPATQIHRRLCHWDAGWFEVE